MGYSHTADFIGMSRTKKERLWEEQKGRCHFCNARLNYEEADTDHLNPASLGGSDSIQNRVLCCIRINRWFGNMPYSQKKKLIKQWRRERQGCKPKCFCQCLDIG